MYKINQKNKISFYKKKYKQNKKQKKFYKSYRLNKKIWIE